MSGGPAWLDALDALEFRPPANGGRCVVHRRAFRVLLGEPNPEPGACLAYFLANAEDFEKAASAKVAARGLWPGAAFHLNSRDIRRALAAEALVEPAGRATRDEPEQG